MRVKCINCGKEFNQQSNLDLHIISCKGIKKEIKKNKIIDKLPINIEKKEIKIKECKESKTGNHDLIVLRPINNIQKRAIQNGYTAYCRICEELI